MPLYICICRNADFLANIEAEVTQQLLRLGSHASLVVFGGNNEVEQSLEWYQESRVNLAMFVSDYNTLFEHTVGKLVQQVGAWCGAGLIPQHEERKIEKLMSI